MSISVVSDGTRGEIGVVEQTGANTLALEACSHGSTSNQRLTVGTFEVQWIFDQAPVYNHRGTFPFTEGWVLLGVWSTL